MRRWRTRRTGAFYVWSQREIEQVLGDGAPFFIAYYNVKILGNAPASGDPHGEFKNQNILYDRARSAKSRRSSI
jgi:uncharacterized protein YyaL (SSP411 family)